MQWNGKSAPPKNEENEENEENDKILSKCLYGFKFSL